MRFAILFATLLMTAFSVHAQDKKLTKTEKLAAAVDAKSYIFYAESAQAANGMAQHISDYSVTVTGDTLVSLLPYFGNGNAIPSDMTKSPLEFTSYKFDQVMAPVAKGGFQIMITLRDQQEVKRYIVTVLKSGYATLQVVNANRTGIIFNGSLDKK